MMTCTVCPNCGLDLEKFAPIDRGNVQVTAHDIHWKGREVPLTPMARMIVSAIIRAEGLPVSRPALAEIIGSEGKDPDNVVSVMLCRANKEFRTVDPTFDAVRNVWGVGVRWADEANLQPEGRRP